MGPRGAPEELRFDFGESLAEEEPATGRAAGDHRDPGDDAATALRRRVDEVIAVAHARGQGGNGRGLRVAEVVAGTRGEPGEAEAPPVGDRPAGDEAAGDEAAGEKAGRDRPGTEQKSARRAPRAKRPRDRARGEEAPEERSGAAPGVGEADAEVEIGREGTGEDAEVVAADGRSSDGALSVAGFYERLRRAISQSFPGEWWVTGEIRGLRESRGHHYLELADEGADPRGRAPAQQLEVACWSRDWPAVASALAEAGVSLEVGRVVRVRGRVSVWEGGSKLRFTMTAIDVEALLGGIAAARRRLLQALAAEDLLEANARLGRPLVPLRIGLVTSPGSEAHRDFVGELERSGYAFEVLLEPSLVQGPEAPFQVAGALGRLVRRDPDLAVVVRGGGARGDLAAFDSEEVARAIATAPFPVWTGVGHTGDRSVADEVAQRACITPTACGQAVVGLVDAYVAGVTESAARLSSLARIRLEGAGAHLGGLAGALSRGARHQLERRVDGLSATGDRLRRGVEALLVAEDAVLARSAPSLAAAAGRSLAREEREVHRRRQVLRAYDPTRQLERGWSLTRDGAGRLVRATHQAGPGTELRTRLSDGEVVSVVSEGERGGQREGSDQ